MPVAHDELGLPHFLGSNYRQHTISAQRPLDHFVGVAYDGVHILSRLMDIPELKIDEVLPVPGPVTPYLTILIFGGLRLPNVSAKQFRRVRMDRARSRYVLDQ